MTRKFIISTPTGKRVRMQETSLEAATARYALRKGLAWAELVERGYSIEEVTKRTRLKPQSKKARAMRPARIDCVAIVRARAGDMCEARLDGCQKLGVHPHELRRRGQGGSIFDPSNVIWLCFSCHTWAHANPAKAQELGLIVMKKVPVYVNEQRAVQ